MSAEARIERLIAAIERDLGILDALVERHAYGVPLPATRLADLSRLARTLHPALRHDIEGFVAALRA